MAIISELVNTLDHEVGGQLSVDLENLYMFIMDKIIEANINNTIEDLEIAEKLLLTLYEAWADVVNNPALMVYQVPLYNQNFMQCI